MVILSGYLQKAGSWCTVKVYTKILSTWTYLNTKWEVHVFPSILSSDCYQQYFLYLRNVPAIDGGSALGHKTSVVYFRDWRAPPQIQTPDKILPTVQCGELIWLGICYDGRNWYLQQWPYLAEHS